MSPNLATTALQEIQGIADQHYEGRAERGFDHWALKCILADIEPDDDELIAHTALDGSGDLGIDGYWIDDTNNRLIFLQGKFQPRVTRGQAQEFRQAILSLKDEDYVRAHGNSAIREVHPDIFEPLIDEGYSVYAVLAGSGQIAPAALSFASGEGSTPWVFEFGGVTRTKDVQLQVLDLEDLVSLRESLVAAAAPSPAVMLHVTGPPQSPSLHDVPGEYKTIQATVPAQDIVDAYGSYRASIFRYNPRGPLGANKVNKEIEATLRDQSQKHNFHLLNNGLTIVCDSVVYDEPSQALNIADFQIVNGCQTAFTLHSLRQEVTDQVLIGVRIIEGENWAPMIARSTNWQTAVRPEQLASLGAEHNRIMAEFNQLDPPWFYEKQRGARRFMTAAERQIHRATYGKRILSIKEVGQFGTAFLGYPILAKYDLQVVFERSEEIGKRLYDAIFGLESRADQLLLPVLVGRGVESHVKQRIQELRAEREAQGEEHSESPAFSELDWLPYARMHILGLIGEILRSENPDEVTENKLLTDVESRLRRATLEDWFDRAFKRAFDAVEFYVEVEREAGHLTNLREFFRSPSIWANMQTRARRR